MSLFAKRAKAHRAEPGTTKAPIEPEGATTAAGDSEDAPETTRRRRGLVVGVAAGSVLALVVAGLVVSSQHRTVALDVDGQTREVSTFVRDIDGLLEAEGIELGEHDLVVPGPGEPLVDGTDVVVRSAQQVDFVVEGQYRSMWTTALTAAEALESLSVGGRSVSLTASRSTDARTDLGLDLPLVGKGPVVIVADGEERTVQVSGESDVAGVLRQAEMDLAATDRVEVSVDSAGQAVLTITRVETADHVETEDIDYETVERETSDLYSGESRVVQEGAEGERTYTSRQLLIDGEVHSSKRVSVDVTTEPTDRIVEVGTAERPAPEPAPSSDSGSNSSSGANSSSDSSSDSGSSSDSSSGGGDVSGDVWARLAQCESGGNPSAVSPSGTYHGLYQFSVSTWQSVGGSGLPSQASPAEQTQRAQALQARSGWGQWPHCSSVLGLR